MTYPNPNYDPEWKARHDAHAVERERAQQEATRLIEAGDMASEAYIAARARWETHLRACQAAIFAQHKTVQDYARWRFSSAPPDMSDHDVGVPVPVVDFETLRTIEEVDALWSRLHDWVEEAVNDRRGSLPIGQPLGLRAFADVTAPSLHRHWREFTAQDLYPGGYGYAPNVLTLMTVDEQADGRHICFMHKWGGPGDSVMNNIDRIATAVYREACVIAAGQPATQNGWLGRLIGRKLKPLDPGRFHFYEHMPPTPHGGRETFSRMVLRFEEGAFTQPDWRRYPVIPRAIQSARFDLAAAGLSPGLPLLAAE